jgi:hypothetical protein
VLAIALTHNYASGLLSSVKSNFLSVNTALAQLVAGVSLPIGRLFNGIGYYRCLGLLIDSVFLVGFTSAFVYKGLDAALRNHLSFIH